MKHANVLIAAITLVAIGAMGAPAKDRVYPQGKLFPFMGFSGVPMRDAHFGFSVAGPSYAADQAPALAAAEKAGLSFPYKIGIKMNFHAKAPDKPLTLNADEIRRQITEQVTRVVDRKSICWWYLGPEEIRYWRKNEMAYLKAASEAIRAADPLKRPIWMYEPNFRNAESLAKTGQYLDVIGKGAYVNLAGYQDSRIWVRWSVEQEVLAIEQLAKANDNRQRIPLLMPELCKDPVDPAHDHLIPRWVRHDVYLGLMSGAKGVAIWSLFRRAEVRRTWPIWYDAYAHVANDLTGPLALGQVFLFGEKTKRFPTRIVYEPKTVELKKRASKKLEVGTTGDGERKEDQIIYPSMTVSEYEHEGVTFLFLCNSSNERLTYLASVSNEQFEVTDLFARRGYTHKDDRLYGWLEPLEVKCYRIVAR
ncbi:MAG: hypothetical protein ACPGVU_21865 [Limisphaerales bacterium]